MVVPKQPYQVKPPVVASPSGNYSPATLTSSFAMAAKPIQSAPPESFNPQQQPNPVQSNLVRSPSAWLGDTDRKGINFQPPKQATGAAWQGDLQPPKIQKDDKDNKGGKGGGKGKDKKKPSAEQRALRKWLAGDSTYQQQESALMKELEDFKVSSKGQRQDVREDFDVAKSRLSEERTRALEDMLADFAARGVATSGMFLDTRGDYNKEYQNKIGDLSRDRQRTVADLLEQLGMYRTSNRNQLMEARQDAIRRRAAQLGLGL